MRKSDSETDRGSEAERQKGRQIKASFRKVGVGRERGSQKEAGR